MFEHIFNISSFGVEGSVFPFVFTYWGSYNKVAEAGWLKKKSPEVYFLTVLETRSLKSSYWQDLSFCVCEGRVFPALGLTFCSLRVPCPVSPHVSSRHLQPQTLSPLRGVSQGGGGREALHRGASLCSPNLWVPLDWPHCVSSDRYFDSLGFTLLLRRLGLALLTFQGCEWGERWKVAFMGLLFPPAQPNMGQMEVGVAGGHWSGDSH